MKKTSMQDIADALGISKNSVSQALRGKPGVSRETQQEVLKKATEMGYEYNLRSTRKNQHHFLLIATKFAFTQLSFFGEIIKSLEYYCGKNNHLLTKFVITEEILATKKLPDNLSDYNGIFILSHSDNHYLAEILDYKIPTVMIDHHDPLLISDVVLSKNTDGAFYAIQLLLENGHKRIGFIGDIEFSPSYLERYRGYQRALKNSNISQDHSIEITQIEETQGALFNRIKQVKVMPDAWFCVNSGLAFMLNNYLQTEGYTIPDDISIICYDDTEFTRMAIPTITNVATDLDYMGELAVELMLRRIKEPKKPFVHTQILPNINLYNSVKLLNN